VIENIIEGEDDGWVETTIKGKMAVLRVTCAAVDESKVTCAVLTHVPWLLGHDDDDDIEELPSSTAATTTEDADDNDDDDDDEVGGLEGNQADSTRVSTRHKSCHGRL
jgi:hypothetical protein